MRDSALSIALGLSCVLALWVGTEWLTPLWLLSSADDLPGILWLVVLVLGQAATAVILLKGQRRRGLTYARRISVAVLVIYVFNFYGALIGLGYDGRTDPGALKFWYFYLLQMAIVVMAWIGLRKERRASQAAS